MNDETQKRRPSHKLVQEAAYYVLDKNGNRVRKTKNIDLAYGWLETSKNGTSYISFADAVQAVLPDADGRIKRVVFELTYDNTKT